jgi:predicted ATPase
MNNIIENIRTITSIKEHGKFLKYIDFIRFPYYRNMEIHSQINFDFPLTVIVGQNGCGKSSLLHAIYGMPQKHTPYRFWFDTKVDPIEYYNDEKMRHSFWYQYAENGKVRQVVKARIKREDDPNYWETSRPLAWAGMNPSERHSPIEKNVVYIDFRSELSAFDKYFYFGNTIKSKVRNKQEFIRRKSSFLQKALTTENYIAHSKGRELNKPVERLSSDELNVISYILGRKYNEALSIFHSFFRNEGYSVLFKASHANYSEAFAGSGEMAVVRLVQKVSKAPDYSLIILDEPEVSLHPGAQERLTNFLLEEIKRKKHQIVITSHSPSIIKNLPKEAIKVLYQNPSNGKFLVKEDLLPEEAFFHIEFSNENKKRVYFEDKLAKEIFYQVLKKLGTERESLFKLIYNLGGCTVMYSEFATVYCREDYSNDFMVFDGDQKKADLIDWRTLSTTDLTEENLKNTIKNLIGCEIKFSVDGGANGGNQEQKIGLYKKYLDYYRRNVFFLPLELPEDIIWDNSTAQKFLSAYIENCKIEVIISQWDNQANSKEKFAELSNYMYGTDNNSSDKIFNIQQQFIQSWILKKDNNYNNIVSIIDKIASI